MTTGSNHAPNAGRRDFLRLAAAGAATLAFLPTVSAKVGRTLEPISDYGGLLSKTEEFQEEFLTTLPDAEKRPLLSRIRSIRPERYDVLASENEWRHLLRTGYVALKIGKTKISRNPGFKETVSVSDILVPSASPLRPSAPWNATFRATFFQGMPKLIEPFDFLASENHAIAINGNYGVFEGWRCREHTWDGRPLPTFLLLEHGDHLETAMDDTVSSRTFGHAGKGIEMPAASIDTITGTPLCSQVARRLGESFWLPFARGDSAISSLASYGKSRMKYSWFSQIPESKTMADVFMRSLAHPSFGHRAFAYKTGAEWFVVDPYSHRQPISAAQYRRRKDVFAIVAFEA